MASNVQLLCFRETLLCLEPKNTLIDSINLQTGVYNNNNYTKKMKKMRTLGYVEIKSTNCSELACNKFIIQQDKTLKTTH